MKRWNDELATDHGRELWGKRTIKYFVFDTATEKFAPAKYCAYINTRIQEEKGYIANQQLMSMPLYTSLDESEPKFDGNLAQTHLQRHLHMSLKNLNEPSPLASAFAKWQALHTHHIRIPPTGPCILIGPTW